MPVLRRARLEDGGEEIPDFLALPQFPPDARLYARSASDDKAPIIALVTALDALTSMKQRPTSNVKVILDGEEEARSPSLAATMGRYRDKYRADLMLILDGPLHASGKPTLSFGARGNLVFQLTAFGPKFALHSGHYGNWAPNPAWDLTRLLASMKDANGRVLIKGFYEDVPPLSSEGAAFWRRPRSSDELMRFFGIGRTEQVGPELQRGAAVSVAISGARQRIHRRSGAHDHPDRATAEMTTGAGEGNGSRTDAQRILTHVRAEGYPCPTQFEPDDEMPRGFRASSASAASVTKAYRNRMTLPESQALIRTLEQVWGEPPVRNRTMGGTVPIASSYRRSACPRWRARREFRQQPSQQQREHSCPKSLGPVVSFAGDSAL